MARIAGLAIFLSLVASTDARAEPNYFAWRVAHDRMLAKWWRAEPRCGWTVGGYTCRHGKRFWVK